MATTNSIHSCPHICTTWLRPSNGRKNAVSKKWCSNTSSLKDTSKSIRRTIADCYTPLNQSSICSNLEAILPATKWHFRNFWNTIACANLFSKLRYKNFHFSWKQLPFTKTTMAWLQTAKEYSPWCGRSFRAIDNFILSYFPYLLIQLSYNLLIIVIYVAFQTQIPLEPRIPIVRIRRETPSCGKNRQAGSRRCGQLSGKVEGIHHLQKQGSGSEKHIR